MKREDIQIGLPVIYYSVITDEGERLDPIKTAILSESWEVCGAILCNVAGVAGGVDIEHLELLTPGALIAAKLNGLKDISEEEIAKSLLDSINVKLPAGCSVSVKIGE